MNSCRDDYPTPTNRIVANRVSGCCLPERLTRIGRYRSIYFRRVRINPSFTPPPRIGSR